MVYEAKKYEAKNFENLIGLAGFSEQLLKNHFALYQGYVNNINKLLDILSTMIKEGKTNTPEYAELKRRLGWEWNGMRLHELYFENMDKTQKKLNQTSKLYKAISLSFGSYENWENDFKALGAIRGIGWVVLYYDPVEDRLINAWINEHDVGHLSGAIPLLVMDVFEHAYMLDYQLKRVDYIEAFFKAINWPIVEKRFDKAKKMFIS
ncbi:MAG: superoxide dismutase [Candidatus Pacearchaeota archaeon]